MSFLQPFLLTNILQHNTFALMPSFVEIPEDFFDLILRGDDRCPLKKEDRFVKVRELDEVERHPIGAQGKVLGSILHPELGPAYLVLFDGDTEPSLSVGARLEKL